MITTEQIILIGVFGITILIGFLLLILSSSCKKKRFSDDKASANQDITRVDIKLWLQERSFWIPRLIMVLTSNSLLFLGYVRVRFTQFGGIIAIFATIGNVLYFIYLASFAKKHDSLQKRIASKIPIEYQQRTLTGRWGFVPLIVILELIWLVSILHSFFGWFK